MERLSDKRILELCQGIDELFVEEQVRLPHAFNVIGTWVICTVMENVAANPEVELEEDIYQWLVNLRESLERHIGQARAEGFTRIFLKLRHGG